MQGIQETIRRADLRFDVVTMWDVIEHLDDPAGELDTAFNLLKPGGYLAVHTMDIDSLAARLLGERWPWLMDMHIHYFSQDTLAQMLRAAGFEVVWSGAQGRYLRLGYLASRVRGMNEAAGRLADGVVSRLKLTHLAVPVNFGDLFTVYARRPHSG
jgi:SAM-dependent methyltransferase